MKKPGIHLTCKDKQLAIEPNVKAWIKRIESKLNKQIAEQYVSLMVTGCSDGCAMDDCPEVGVPYAEIPQDISPKRWQEIADECYGMEIDRSDTITTRIGSPDDNWGKACTERLSKALDEIILKAMNQT